MHSGEHAGYPVLLIEVQEAGEYSPLPEDGEHRGSESCQHPRGEPALGRFAAGPGLTEQGQEQEGPEEPPGQAQTVPVAVVAGQRVGVEGLNRQKSAQGSERLPDDDQCEHQD